MSFTINIDRKIYIRACRICLDYKCSKMITINDQSGLLKQFQDCFGLQISELDTPQHLCLLCVDKVKKYSKFKELCYKSDKLWKSLTTVKCCVEKLTINLVKNEPIENENECYETNDINIESFHNDLSVFGDMSIKNNIKIIKTETVEDNIQHEIPVDKNLSDTSDTVLLLDNKQINCTSGSQSKVKNIFKCKWCLRNFGSKLCYLKHVKLCNKKKQSATGQHHISNSGKEIKSRYTSKTMNVSNFCGVCKFSTTYVDKMTRHLEEHWTNYDLKCAICEFIAKDRAAMAAHRYTHYTNKASSYLCHICKKKPKSKITLEFHYRKVHLNKSGGLCSQPKCDKVFNNWISWKRHEKFHNHPGYICDMCGKKYRHKHLIAEHLMNHINPPTHVCDVCGKTFLRLRSLKSHIRNMHVKSDPQKCSHCNRIFKNELYLKIHQKQLTKEKIWKCDFCPMEYSLLCLLKSHLRSHSDERPHCCHVCGSRYKAKCQLLIHMRNHSGDRPYKCMVCEKAFKSSQLLKRHTMIHTGIMPHKCMHCDKSFLYKDRMIKHCAVRHKDMERSNDAGSE